MSTSPFAKGQPLPIPSSYPGLTTTQVAAINAHLIDVVGLRNPGRLTDAQLAELKECMEIQNRNAEILHQFVLSSADEPVFIRPIFQIDQA